MKLIGRIEYILNDSYFLASITEKVDLDNGTKLEVIGSVNVPNVGDISYTKGTLVVVNRQQNELYLLSVEFVAAKIPMFSTLLNSFGSSRTLEPHSAAPIIDKSQSLNIEMNREIQVGDRLRIL